MDTTSAPAPWTPLPTRSTGSHQQSTTTLCLMSQGRRRGQCAELAVGEKCLVEGMYPRVTPFVSRRPLTRPRQPPYRRTLRPARPAPIRIGIMSAYSVDATRTSSQSRCPTPSPRDNDWYIIQPQPCRRHPSGRAAITHLPPPHPLPHSPPAGPTAGTPAPTPMSRTSSPVIRRGLRTQPLLPHTQCILGSWPKTELGTRLRMNRWASLDHRLSGHGGLARRTWARGGSDE